MLRDSFRSFDRVCTRLGGVAEAVYVVVQSYAEVVVSKLLEVMVLSCND